MDEKKGKDVCVGSVSESTTVVVSEHVVAGEAQVEGPHSEGVERVKDGGACNGDDIMVEVLGSDVYFDGVCTHGEARRNVVVENEIGTVGDGKSLGGGTALSEAGLRGIGGSSVGASKRGTETGVEGFLGIVESRVEQTQAVVVEGEVMVREEENLEGGAVKGETGREIVGSGSGTGDMMAQDATVLDNEAQNAVVGAEDGYSLVVLGSTHGGAQVVHVEEVVMVAREAGLEKEMIEVAADRGGQVMDCVVDAIEDMKSKELVALDEKASISKNENGVGDSSVVVGSVGVESQVVKENAKNVEHLERGLVVEGDQPGGGLADGGLNVAYNLMPQKVGVVDDNVWNPGISSVVVCATSSAENSSLQTGAFPEKASVIFSEQEKVLTSGSSALDGIVSSSGRKLMEDTSSGGTKNGDVDPKSLDEKGKVAAKGDTLCSNMEGVKIDSIDESATCSMEEQQGNIEQAGESSRSQRDVSPTPVSSSCLPNQAAVGGVDTAIDDKGPSQLNLIVMQEMEVDKQVFEEQGVGVETVCLSTASHGHKCANSTSDLLVTIGEAAAKYEKLRSDSNVEVTETVDKDGMLSCSVNDQNLKEERMCGITQAEAHITNRMESDLMECEAVLDSINEVSVPTKKDEALESEEYLEMGVGSDLLQIGCEDAMLLDQPIQVVVKDVVATVDGSDLLNSNDDTDTKVIGREEITPMDAVEILNSNMDVPAETEEFEECPRRSMAGDFAQIDSKCELQVEVEEQEMRAEQVGLEQDQGMEVEEYNTDTEQSKADEEKFLEQEALNAGSIGEAHQASYQLPSENEGELSVSDLVWGKVRSHPWWPGQIFDPADSSEKAMKHHRKDCFLVAYFGDRTFAWNEASQLKAFRTHFSHIEKQSNSEALQNAVDCALKEVSRRVELGLACSCMPKDAFDRIKFQKVENTGIRQESITRDTVDRSASASSFEPDKFIKYLKALAQHPSGDSDRLEVVIAKAQLLAFCRLKGYRSLPEFQFCGESEPDTLVSEDRMRSSEVFEHVDDELTSLEQEISKNQKNSSNKHKQDFKDDVFYGKKERSLLELMGGSMDSPDGDDLLDGKTSGSLVSPSSGKKRKTVDYHDDHGPQDGRKTIAFAKVSSTMPPSFPKPSFKIGDCIRRVASQMTGSPSILKFNSERPQKLDGGHDMPAGDEADASFQDSEDIQRERVSVSTEYSSLDDLLLQLQMAAQDPQKGYGLSDIIVSFFSDFRNSIVVGQHSRRELLAMDKVGGGKRKKSSRSVVGSPETYEFEDMSDTYWTDRVVQNGSEEQPPRRNKKREYQVVPVLQDTPQVSRRPYSRKRYSDGNNAVAADKPAGHVDENSPAEIVMNFSEVNSVPTETNLNKMFRRFGPLKESETEVDRDTSRARVVYKHSSDAEVAFSSAGRFNIFGPTLVNYQINYTPSALFKASPMDTAQGHEMQLDLAALEVNLV